MLTARNADRHQLYEFAVQQPVLMVGFIEHLFKGLRRGPCKVLREDFCGTANLASTWVRSGRDRRAIGVDISAGMIRYADRRNRKPLGDAAKRLKLVRADVRRCSVGPRADVLVSLNFSHFIYKTRADLLAYLRHARRRIRPGGLIILDAYGGPASLKECTDRRRFDDFTYLWEQLDYDPITHEVINVIHFHFRDGSKIRDAFTYWWRLWTLPELREILEEAGFTHVRNCFEVDDGFSEKFDFAEHDAWVAYVVARA